VHLSRQAASTASPAQVRLSFRTSSLVLLGKVLRAAASGGRITGVSLAFRAPGRSGRPATELVDTFASAVVSSFQEDLSGTPAGRVSLVLPAVSHPVRTPGALERAGPFAPSAPSAAQAYVTLDPAAAPSHPVTAVRLTEAAPGAPLGLGFATSSLPVIEGIMRYQGAAAAIPALTLSVRAGGRDQLTCTFSGLGISSFAENLSGSLSGTAMLVVRQKGDLGCCSASACSIFTSFPSCSWCWRPCWC
jgi:hypothetical protein